MKTLFIAFIFCFCYWGISFSQSLKGKWIIQNPEIPSLEEIMTFDGNSSCLYYCQDIETGRHSPKIKYFYEQHDSILILSNKNGKAVLVIRWLSQTKFLLYRTTGEVWCYVIIGSCDDNFMNNYYNRAKKQ
jgi:hypothetical protein